MSQNPKFSAMVLEDHDFQRKVGVQVLKHCGATTVLEAADGSKALDLILAAEEPVDLLVCDLNMPGMDGLAFLRHLAERRGTSSVILASALDPAIIRAAEIMARSYGLRILGIVEKPLSRAKLQPLILRHFSQYRLVSRPALDPMPLDEIIMGIERRQFEPFFQPKVSIRTGALVGVEALMRWRHPERGLIPPGAFIPVMEVNGLVTPVTFTLIEDSLAFRRQWSAAGLDVPIAINISVESLADTALPDRMVSLVAAAKFTPSCLTLEVTETVAMTDLGHSLETLARLRMNGFHLSIDDYGTGFSSMQQLTRLPLSELKIDQAFITGAAQEPILETLVETSVLMAKRLNLKTVAEGVETSDDWDLVARLGCDAAQGYFIARPMPGGELVSWHKTWQGMRGEMAV